MRVSEFEAKVLNWVDRVRAGERIEDSRVEAKRQWMDPRAVARRIAGHANSCGGDDIVWVFGVDEDRAEVVGANRGDLANWWPQVEAEFDEVPPTLIHAIDVPVGDVTVAALLIGCARLPFVVKNHKRDSTNPGPLHREVPYRDGTRLITARRQDILRMLGPSSITPDVDVLRCSFSLPGKELTCSLYFSPRSDKPVTIPFYKCSSKLSVFGEHYEADRIVIKAPVRWGYGGGTVEDSSTIEHTTNELHVFGPGFATLRASFSALVLPTGRDLRFVSTLGVLPNARPIVIDQTIELRGTEPDD